MSREIKLNKKMLSNKILSKILVILKYIMISIL